MCVIAILSIACGGQNNSDGDGGASAVDGATAVDSARATDGSMLDADTDPGSYGNVGDPYEGVPFDPTGKVALDACGPLSASTSYYLTTDVGADPGAICFSLGGREIVLDLRGQAVTGRIHSVGIDANGMKIFNGTVDCNVPGLGEGCLKLSSDTAWASPSRVHHLTLHNAYVPPDTNGVTALSTEYSTGQDGTNLALEIDHVTCAVDSAPLSNRSVCLNIGTRGKVDVHHNHLTCPGDASACNTIQLTAGVAAPVNATLHHNYLNLATNTLAPAQGSARGIIISGFDQSSDGPSGNVIHDNVCVANNNRCFRLRQVKQTHMYNNTVQRCSSPKSAGCYTLGDPDNDANAIYDFDTLIENETIEMTGGKAFWIRNVGGITVRNITLTGVSGKLGEVTGYPLGSPTEGTFCNVTAASSLDDSTVVAGSTANVFSAGTWTGAGTINVLGSCP